MAGKRLDRALVGSVARILLGAWFGLVTLAVLSPQLLHGAPWAWDAIAYTDAARRLIEGGSQWDNPTEPIGFAAPPTSLLPYLPFVWMPDPLIRVIWLGIGATSAAYVVRSLGLPVWWLLFPPLAHALATGGTALLVLALLVRGGVMPEVSAVILRIYAAIPLALTRRWRSVGLGLLMTILVSPLLGGVTYLRDFGKITQALGDQTAGSSVLEIPILIPLVVLALIRLGRARAAWLVVPLLWPNTQFCYAVIAMPALASSPLVALGLSVPVAPALATAGVVGQAALEAFRGPIGCARSGESRYSAPTSG